MRNIVIMGSSRKDGNTKNSVDKLNLFCSFDMIDLNNYNIGYYDYNHNNQSDSYLAVITNIINNYDTIIFATPVYWYAMSGVMKVFFDRTTDLLDIDKELGRELRFKNMAVLSSSTGDHLGDIFWLPFIKTANYLGMNYIGNIHTIPDIDQIADFAAFEKLINEATTK